MKPKQILIGAAVILCAGLGLFFLIKSHGSGYGGDDESADENVTNIVAVQVGLLTNITLHSYVDAYGMVGPSPATADQPAAGGTLSASAAGVVSRVNVLPGQKVAKGDVLVELDSAAATFAYSQAEVERQKELFAQQNTSLKNLEDAQAQLNSLEVIAPVSGTVTSVNVKPGQAVDAGAVVADVIDLDRLAVSAKIPAAQVAELQAGQDVQILADPPVTTSLLSVSPAVDADDGTVTAWATVPSGSQLRPGQFVQLKIVTAAHTNCLAAPSESIVTDDDGNSTVALVNGHEADQNPVQLGLHEDEWTEVDSTNLKAGDRVVTVGAYGLPDKTQIQIQNPADESSATNSPASQ